jgi:plasmid stabilization system protein ParE
VKVVVSPEAAERLEAQVRYIRDQHAPEAAERLHKRVLAFLEKQLTRFPRSGRNIDASSLWEVWIPKTRLIVWYEIREDHVAIVSIWHAAQDRNNA